MPHASFLTHVARAVAFLSRIPVPNRFFVGDDGVMSETVRAFPVAGLVIALPGAIILAALLALDGAPMLSALLALAAGTLASGGLHEDGLADSADGLGGGRDRERSLAIMKDSRIGSYGVLALIFSLALRASALSSLALPLGPLGAGAALIAGAALSRAVMLRHWVALPPARPEGLAGRAGLPSPSAVRIALLTGLVLALGLPFLAGADLLALILAIAAALLVEPLFTRLCRQKIGGHTGDTIGATQQLADVAFLAALALAA